MLFFASFVYWLDRYEKEPAQLLGIVFLWGAIIAAGAAFILNSSAGSEVLIFTHSEGTAALTTGAIIAPVIEESLKGLAVLLVFMLYRREFDSVLDGIIYASMVALGFAATENIYYLYTYGYLPNGLAGVLTMFWVRVILVGWQHPFYTSFLGIGIALARLNRSRMTGILYILAGWLAAVLTHSIHNTIANLISGPGGILFGTILDWTGWIAMFVFITWSISQEKKLIQLQLRDELTLGFLSSTQYQVACSAWSQTISRLSALGKHRYAATNRFYQVCAELAHKKHQLAVRGDEGGNIKTITALQAELRSLAPIAVA